MATPQIQISPEPLAIFHVNVHVKNKFQNELNYFSASSEQDQKQNFTARNHLKTKIRYNYKAFDTKRRFFDRPHKKFPFNHI